MIDTLRESFYACAAQFNNAHEIIAEYISVSFMPLDEQAREIGFVCPYVNAFPTNGIQERSGPRGKGGLFNRLIL